MTCKDIGMMLKKRTYWLELNPSCLHQSIASYPVSYCVQHDELHFSSTYQLIVKKLENKIVYYKETVECRHLIFWPQSQERGPMPYCKTGAKSEGYN
jgi:hypothetical protein